MRLFRFSHAFRKIWPGSSGWHLFFHILRTGVSRNNAPAFPIIHLPFPEIKNIGLLWYKHPYFWGKTSVLLPKEVRCFASSGQYCFASSELLSSLHKKSFLKISYISYTHTSNILYLLKISGVGLGVGFVRWCRIGEGFWRFCSTKRQNSMHFPYASCKILMHFARNMHKDKGKRPQWYQKECHKRGAILHPTPKPTPNPTPENISKH